MSHSFSRSWKSPQVVMRDRWTRILKSRDHICPDSPFLPRLFNLPDHEKAMGLAKQNHDSRKADSTEKDLSVRSQWATQIGSDAESLTAFGGRKMWPSQAAVLGSETIWCQDWTNNKDFIAPWPTLAELKHEGDDRVSTSVSHRRFFPIPRFPSASDISWNEVAFLPQHHMDQISNLSEPESMSPASFQDFETHINDLEGASLLGEDLMSALDPLNIYD
ncbi:hypothetical protein K461DRAFT_292963 [Myriangium duriaei CBS 260.36]|uniref:Uncharacterized protein n=1 Tax=Myriangium duriaei CBS 260.36 TaxID=1168546 RepID=A0A9P4MIK6_9PEZI|nr:hypothetical protein K461DRAFT_292963 [Myriangium duriaei CBS 260.36]